MHNILHFTYKENVNKQAVENELDRYCEKESDWGCGLPSAIRWIDKTFDSYSDALNYIESIDSSYSQLAVKYREYPNLKTSKKYEDLKARLSAANDRYNQLNNAIHFKDVKSSYIACKKCGSKISSKYIKTNLCPVCYSDMRPESTIKHIKQLKVNVEKLNASLDEEISKLKAKQVKNSEIHWVVKIEYHS